MKTDRIVAWKELEYNLKKKKKESYTQSTFGHANRCKVYSVCQMLKARWEENAVLCVGVESVREQPW